MSPNYLISEVSISKHFWGISAPFGHTIRWLTSPFNFGFKNLADTYTKSKPNFQNLVPYPLD